MLSNKEDLSNKVTALSAQNTHTEYPSAKAVYDNLPTTMGASGSGHKGGLVPDTSSTAGTTKFLREDGTWEVPAYTAAQVQSDWNATSGMGAILNKPTIPTVPTNVSAFTNDAGYVTANTYGTVYVETAASTTAKTATIPMSYSLRQGNTFILCLKTSNTKSNATLSINNTTAKSVRIDGVATTSSNWKAGMYLCYYDGTYYQMKSNTNPFGSSASISGNTITIDGNSVTVLTSHQDISGKEDKMPISTKSSNFTATVGNYYKVNIGASVSRTITLTTPSDSTKVSNCIFYVTTSTSPSLTISAASGVTVYFSDNYSIEASSNYEINALWNGTAWFITSVEFT